MSFSHLMAANLELVLWVKMIVPASLGGCEDSVRLNMCETLTVVPGTCKSSVSEAYCITHLPYRKDVARTRDSLGYYGRGS